VSFLILASSISAWPIFTGDMNGFWRPAPPPQDYVALNKILEERGDLHHIAWFPQYSGEQRAIWSNSRGVSENAAPTGEFPIRTSSLSSYSTSKHYFFDYYNPVRGVRTLNPLPIYGGNLSEAYSPLNIHYLGINYDTVWSKYRESLGVTTKNTADEFANNGSSTTLLNGSYLSAFELHNDAEELYTAKPILVLDRLSTYGELLPFIDKHSSLIFGTSQEAIERGAEVSDHLILSDSMDLLTLVNNKVVTQPAKFTNVVDPENTWSPASPHDIILYNHLDRKNLSWSWPFDHGYGLAYTSAPNAILRLQANIPETDNYQIFVRYLASDAGGAFSVIIDGTATTIGTHRDHGSKFGWANLGSYGLSAGKKEIALENIIGLNLVNVMIMIPSNIPNVYDYLETAVSKKDLIYFYEAEHDFSRLESGGELAGTRISDAGLNFVKNGTIGLTLNILKESDYSLTLKGKGNFSFNILDKNGNNEQIDRLQSDTLNYIHSNSSIHLTPGEHELSITSTGESYLDQALLYTGKQPIDQLLNSVSPGQIVSYDKITPTSYEVKVKSDAPFLLAFAEGYDRFWTAKVRSADNLTQFNSLPLYSVINGFWIDKTGEFTLIVEFEPQEWFNISLIISAIAFACALLYLVYRHFKIKKLSHILTFRGKWIKRGG
jgi:hypothetical protein